MDISRNNIDELNATVTIKIGKEDYDSRVKGVLADYRKKATLKGFRPGKVPQGLIQKMYGKPALVEEINKILSEALAKYIEDEKLMVLGEPLPNLDHKKQIDFDTDTEFEFVVDLGLSPRINVDLSDKDEIIYYNVQVSDKLRADYLDNFQRRYGEMLPADALSTDEMFKANLQQLDEDGNMLEHGIQVDEAVLSFDKIKSEEVKSSLIGSKVGDVISIDLKKAFENEIEIAGLLKMKKEDLPDNLPLFNLTITEITKFQKAEVNQELFNKAYGEGVVSNEEEFMAKIEEDIKLNLQNESDYKYHIDAIKYLQDKYALQLPDEFLKRWLTESNEKLTKEEIEAEYPHFADNLKWTLIKNSIIKTNEIKVSEEDILGIAIESARQQFRQYGLNEVPDQYLQNYANEMLKKEDERRGIVERTYESRVISLVKSTVTLKNTDISFDDFNKLFEQ